MSILTTDLARKLKGLLFALLVLGASRHLPAGESDSGLRAKDDPAAVALRIVQEEPTIKAAIGSITSLTQTLAIEVVDNVVGERLPNYKSASYQFTVQDNKDGAIVWIHLYRNTTSTLKQKPWSLTRWSIDESHYSFYNGRHSRSFSAKSDMIEFVSSHKAILSRVGQIQKIEMIGETRYAGHSNILFREEKDNYIIVISGSKGKALGSVKYLLRGYRGKMKLIERTWTPLPETALSGKKK